MLAGPDSKLDSARPHLAQQRHASSRQGPPVRQRRSLAVHADGEKGQRQPWDLGRFVQTVTYFNQPPSAEQVLKALVEQPAKLARQLTGGNLEEQKSAVMTLVAPEAGVGAASSGAAGSSSRREVVLVTGATGGVGRRVVSLLLQRGRHVRALVRDAGRGRSLLGGLPVAPGGRLELAVADLTRPDSLVADITANVRAVISCTAPRVTPKEGDTADREKYRQGVKFYDSVVEGDTPEAVDFRGIQNLSAAVQQHVGTMNGVTVFAAGGQGQAGEWGPLDDVVMGGVSQSRFDVRAGAGPDGGPAGVFSGQVSSANSGGFASIRTKNLSPAADLGAYAGLQVRLKGDGLRYKCTIRTTTDWDSIGYTKSFDTTPGQWQTVRLPFSDFIPVFRAKTLRDGQQLDACSVSSIQLMLSKFEYDGDLNPHFRTGPFELPFTEIRTYWQEPVAPKLVHISSAGVTRLNRPGIDLAKEPKILQLNDQLGGILTFKLQGEDVVRGSGMPATVVRCCALTEDPGGAQLQLGQGDQLQGQVSRDDVAALCVELLEQPAALNTTFEVCGSGPAGELQDLKAAVSSVHLRPGVTGKTVDGRYTGTDWDPTVPDSH